MRTVEALVRIWIHIRDHPRSGVNYGVLVALILAVLGAIALVVRVDAL